MEIKTYGELKRLLPATGKGRVPGIQQLREKGKVLLSKETVSGRIEIYDDGFFTYEERGGTTVFGVDRCEWMELYGGQKGEKADFDEYAWDLILESAGSARLDHNADYREDYRGEIPLDAADWENNSAFSVRPEHEIREEEQDSLIRKMNMLSKIKKGLKALKPRQREVILLRYVNQLTYEDIGERMGISKATAHVNLERALRKVRKYIDGADLKHISEKDFTK